MQLKPRKQPFIHFLSTFSPFINDWSQAQWPLLGVQSRGQALKRKQKSEDLRQLPIFIDRRYL